MPLVQEMQHPNSLDFANQRRVVMIRDREGLPWHRIRLRVWNLKGEHPSKELRRTVYKDFNKRIGRVKYRYKNCGRKKWKVTKEVESFLLKQLRALRRICICTSTTLQKELLKAKNVELETLTIRRVLAKHGYRWLRRSQKPKYSKEDREAMMDFAQEVVDMAPAELNKHLALCMDGVVVSVAPNDPTERENFCRAGDTHCWRTEDERESPDLAGGGKYLDKQVALNRAVPLWGGIGMGGFAPILFHKYRKVDQWEWSEAVKAGNLLNALRTCRPDRTQGPWHIICDNESFLKAPESRKAHAQLRVHLWHIPARSPDLNPIEKFWSHVRRWLRAKDLADLKAKRPPLSKFGLKQRVRALLRGPGAQTVAKRTVLGLRKTCLKILKAKVHAIHG